MVLMAAVFGRMTRTQGFPPKLRNWRGAIPNDENVSKPLEGRGCRDREGW
jgi:hypothetical protein